MRRYVSQSDFRKTSCDVSPNQPSIIQSALLGTVIPKNIYNLGIIISKFMLNLGIMKSVIRFVV